MASVNYASKYEKQVDEKFTKESITERAINHNFDFTGVNTISIYEVGTAPLNDYETTGDKRYGIPEELETSKYDKTLNQDKSFTFTIDRRNYLDQMMVTEAGRALNRELREVVIPYVDRYRLRVMAEGAGNKGTGAITKNNAYESFLNGVTKLLESGAPMENTVAYINTNFYKCIRQDPAFIKYGDLSQDLLIKGSVGMLESINLIYAPLNRLPENCEFLITNSVATTAAQKISDYRTHDNPPGINGWLVEGRIYFDAFVLKNKANAIYCHNSSAPSIRAAK